MAYAAIQLISTPFEDYAGYWVKFYEQGTVTPLAMATDAGGLTTLAKAEVSSGGTVPVGFLKTAGDALLNPFVNADYDCWLFPTATEADANDTTNAIQVSDNLNTDPYANLSSTDVDKGSALVGNIIQIISTLTVAKTIAGSTTRNLFVQGRSSQKDGFEGLFVWDSSDLSTEVGLDTLSGVFIPPNSDSSGTSGAWVRHNSEAHNIRWFGATGDGVTDDYLAIQAAFDALPANGGDVFAPEGVYAMTAGVTVDKAGSVKFTGEGDFGYDGSMATQFFFTGSGACLTLGKSSVTNHNGYNFRNIYIYGDNSAGQIGIKILRKNSNLFENVRINEMLGAGSIGFDFEGTGDAAILNRLVQCGVRKVTTGLKKLTATALDISGGYWNAVGGTIGMDVISLDSINIHGVNFDSWTTAIDTSNTVSAYAGMRVSGCRFEANTTCIHLSSDVVASMITANYFNMGGSGTGIFVTDGASCIISDNQPHNVTAGVGIFINDAKDQATGNNTALHNPLINAHYGQASVNMATLAATLVNTGTVTAKPLFLLLSTGATASSTALARTEGGEGWSQDKAYTVINWDKKFVASFRLSRTGSGSVNGIHRITLGKATGTGVGDLAVKGVGITFNRFQPVAAVHDGTSLTEVNIEAFNIDVQTHNFMIIGHGDGTFDFSYNGGALVRITGGPTGDGTSGNTVFQIESDNGVDATDNSIAIHDIRIGFEQ